MLVMLVPKTRYLFVESHTFRRERRVSFWNVKNFGILIKKLNLMKSYDLLRLFSFCDRIMETTQ